MTRSNRSWRVAPKSRASTVSVAVRASRGGDPVPGEHPDAALALHLVGRDHDQVGAGLEPAGQRVRQLARADGDVGPGLVHHDVGVRRAARGLDGGGGAGGEPADDGDPHHESRSAKESVTAVVGGVGGVVVGGRLEVGS